MENCDVDAIHAFLAHNYWCKSTLTLPRKSQIVAQPIVRLRVLSSLTVALYTRGYVYAVGLLFTLSVTSVLRFYIFLEMPRLLMMLD